MPASFEFMRALDDPSVDDARLAGVKEANLGEMKRGSLSISDGFVITTSAFDVFARSAELRAAGRLICRKDQVPRFIQR